MATITFRGKVQKITYMNGTLAYQFVKIPKLTRKHCNIPEFRNHPRYGMIANSECFVGVLAKIAKDLGGKIRLDSVPENIHVDTSGFLAVVTITV